MDKSSKNPHGFNPFINMIDKLKYYHREEKKWYYGKEGLKDMLEMHHSGNKIWPDTENLERVLWDVGGQFWWAIDGDNGRTWFDEDEIETKLLTDEDPGYKSES